MNQRVCFYARTSTDRAQTVENQLRELHAVAARLGWIVVAVHTDEGISGTKGRDQRPGYDALLRGIARREFDLVAAWSVCRLGRSLQDLVAFLGEVQNRQIGVYLHTQGIDSTTPAGRAMFGMLGIFAEFERAMIRDRVLAGLDRTRAKGTRLGRPPMEMAKVEAIRTMLINGRGVRETARATGSGSATVLRIKKTLPNTEHDALALSA